MTIDEIKRYKMLFLAYLAVIDVIYPEIVNNEQTAIILQSFDLYRDVATDVVTYLIGLEKEFNVNSNEVT